MSYSKSHLIEEYKKNKNVPQNGILIKDKLRNTEMEIISEDGLIYNGLDGIKCIELESDMSNIKTNRLFKVR